MRTYHIRWDFFICLVLAGLITLGLKQIADKVGLWDHMSQQLHDYIHTTYAPDEKSTGDVGGIASNDIIRVDTLADIMKQEGTFTVSMYDMHYYSGGSVNGGGYSWRMLLFDDGCILAKVNTESIKEEDRDGVTYLTLPVAVVKKEAPDESALRQAKEIGREVPADCYVDMDGGATKQIGDSLLIYITVLSKLLYLIPIGLIFILHALGAKAGLFPRMFPKKNAL